MLYTRRVPCSYLRAVVACTATRRISCSQVAVSNPSYIIRDDEPHHDTTSPAPGKQEQTYPDDAGTWDRSTDACSRALPHGLWWRLWNESVGRRSGRRRRRRFGGLRSPDRSSLAV